ncbi:MAG: hypothetical protein EOM67_01285 [Spirochaetia bacterium]|nr:hypothetical protein [Spirochaetia bacterium]
MKYELETIPVIDALEKGEECLMCTLMKEAHSDAISYYMGSSVMNSETRVSVNTTGFCPTHWNDLIEKRSAQSLALVSHTFLQTTMKELEHMKKSLYKSKIGKGAEKEVDKISSFLHQRETGCLICTKMESRLLRYTYTLVKLTIDNPEFKVNFFHGKGLCLKHTQDVLSMAKEVLDKNAFYTFSNELISLVYKNLERLEKEVWWMSQKYKSEHIDSPWNGCEDAHQRVVKKFIGEGRLFSSSK